MAWDRATMRTFVKRRLGNRSDIADADVDVWSDDALLDLTTQRLEIRSLQGTSAPISTSVAVPAISRPTGVFSVRYIEDPTNGLVLTRFPGGLEQFLRAKQNAPSGKSLQFIEDGANIYLLPAPDAIYSLTPYVYSYATWSTDTTSVPSIEKEWHYGVFLVACIHAFRDFGASEQEMEAEGAFDRWLQRRDTAIRRTARFDHKPTTIQPDLGRRTKFGV